MPLIGVSIAVPDPCGSQLQAYRVALGDQSAQQIPTHVTLVPPTAIPEVEVADLVPHLISAATEHVPFHVRLRGTGTFRPVSPVVFVGVEEGRSECEQMAKSIRTGPLDVSLEFPYHPHVTVAHHLPEPSLARAHEELADTDFRFAVSGFWLYLYDELAGWLPQREFALGS